MACYVQSTVDTKVNELQSHSSRRAKIHQTGNCHRNHDRGQLGRRGTERLREAHHGLLRNHGGGGDGHAVFA